MILVLKYQGLNPLTEQPFLLDRHPILLRVMEVPGGVERNYRRVSARFTGANLPQSSVIQSLSGFHIFASFGA